MSDSLHLERLVRYIAGELPPEERAEVEAWIAADPAHAENLEELREQYRLAEEEGRRRLSDGRFDGAAAWKRLPVRVRAGRRPAVREISVVPPSRRAPVWIGIAASVALAVGFSWWATAGRSVPLASHAVAEYVTPRGQRADVMLKDGTHVLLSVASRLRVPADYGARDRQVYLEGEAYFDVKHDPAARFLVHTEHAVMEDLGTRFDVRAYRGDSAMQVVVTEGRVELRAAGRQVGRSAGRQVGKAAGARDGAAVLVAGQLGRATAAGEITTRASGDVDRYLAWMQGKLVFKNTPLRDALPELSRWFDLEFQLGDSTLAAWPLTASFQNQPSDQILDVLALTLDVRWERHGRVVTFHRH